MLGKLKLLRSSFPDTWIRKTPILLFKTDTIQEDGRIVAMCTRYKNRIILLCVDKNYRRRGFASTLIQRSGANKTDTYLGNTNALKVWERNGFVVDKIENSIFGRRYSLKKK